MAGMMILQETEDKNFNVRFVSDKETDTGQHIYAKNNERGAKQDEGFILRSTERSEEVRFKELCSEVEFDIVRVLC